MIVAALVFSACASIGRPEGGPRDELPPEFVRSVPMPGEKRVDRRSLSLFFNENVQLEDAFNKIVVSPAQIQAPQVTANGRKVTVQLRDTLLPNTTYTVDFGDAIKDLNEGNVLDGFAIDFSTGDSIDSLRISGIVLQASNLEPAQGILVGAYDNLDDSAVRTLPPARIARTNQLGQFTIRNLSPKTYRIYAMNDINRDMHWDRSEDIAFLDTLITPWARPIEVTDTLYDSGGADSLIRREGIQFLPNDVLLTWFNEDYKAQYLKDYKRPDRRTVSIGMGAPPDSLPEIRIVDGPRDPSLIGLESGRWAVPQYSAKRDSLTLWIADSAVFNTDSLRLSVRYRKPDSLERMMWTTDTLRFFYRPPKRSKKEIEADTLPPALDKLEIRLAAGSSQEVYLPLGLTFSQPLASVDTAAIRFETLVDTLWNPVPAFSLEIDSLNPVLGRSIRQKWNPGQKYRISIDSAAIVGIYGEHNRPFSQEITVRAMEDYSNLTFKVSGADSTAIVELLSSSDAPVRSARVKNGVATLRYLSPGTYYARIFFDVNGDSLWTTGSLDSIQPEEVAYFPKKLELKRNWDIEQEWDIYDLPIDKQKPYAILKNKPKLKRGEKAPGDEESDSEDEDPLLGPGGQDSGGRRNSFGGLGGLQQSGSGNTLQRR